MLIVDSSFYDVNRDLKTICVYYGQRQGCEKMNPEHNLGLSATDILLYDPTHFQKIEKANSALFYGDYLSKLGFPFSDVKQLRDLVDCDGDGGTSTGAGGGGGA
ncbi:unnamed protein product [Lactuca saligna]|uniref:Uncharacterized protein n=1 Tax=Lactuca saligna TaxID=75948 RepID=A0AA35YIG1_LACSI|nr:unnamed protein product [Lactuca saligna]